MRRAGLATLFAFILANSAGAQGDNSPLSAIDWFKQHQSVEQNETEPEELLEPEPTPGIEVSILAPQSPDAVGLTSSAVSGFAPTIWQNSETDRLAEILGEMPIPRLPALTILLTRLMLTEAESPIGEPGAYLATRIETLMKLGEIEPAIALLERADPEATPRLFQLWADLSLLAGEENEFCQTLINKPQLSPGYEYLIYCLSRTGNWSAAATTVLAAEALGELDPELVLLLAHYLDPELFEGMPVVQISEQSLTPLTFRLYEGIGEPWPTDRLPLAFAHSDLRGLAGWRTQITAAERLARTGAVSENRLLGIYTANLPSASGGVWDRVADIQALDKAVVSGEKDAIAFTLAKAWQSFETVGLRHVISNLYGEALMRFEWDTSEMKALVHEVAMLSRAYESVARTYWPSNHKEAFLNAIALGETAGTTYPGIMADAIRAGFSDPPTAEHMFLLARDADGEALLSAISKIATGRDSFPDDISQAISVFQVLGLGDFARQVALQLMLSGDD